MTDLGQVAALTTACMRDQVRRPAFGVTVALVGALLALQPRLGVPAAGIGDNARLALEVSISSVVLVTALWAGVRGAMALEGAESATPPWELVAVPQGFRLVTWGHWAGTATTALLLAAGFCAVAALGWIGRPVGALPLDGASAAAFLLAVVCSSALSAALGVFYASAMNRVLAVVALVSHIALVRGIRLSSADSEFGGWLLSLPDPMRLDSARELAFSGGFPWRALLLGAAAAAAQVAMLLLLATLILRRRTCGASARRASWGDTG